MRSASRFALCLALPFAFACGGDDGGDDGNNTTNPTTTVGNDDSGTAATDPTTTDPTTTDPTEADSSGGGGGGMPPSIDSVTWTNPGGCMMNTGGDVDFVITVSDPDTDAADITLSGLLIGCTGDLNAPMVTLVCPNAADYSGTITATDPEGNEDELDITIQPCVDGSAP